MTTSAPALLARRVGRTDDARGVAVDVADHQIELRHDATQPPRFAQSEPPLRLMRFSSIIRHCRAGRIEARYFELSFGFTQSPKAGPSHRQFDPKYCLNRLRDRQTRRRSAQLAGPGPLKAVPSSPPSGAAAFSRSEAHAACLSNFRTCSSPLRSFTCASASPVSFSCAGDSSAPVCKP